MRITGHIPNKLPGRIRCECQARIHSLIRNCTSCGRIVCEQEGSGPCVFCGEFVCTREEAEIISNDTKKGAELQRRLLREAGYGSDIARRKHEDEAQNYRDMLLKADRESVARNKVFDLDSDYYNIETSHYLTAEERKAIQKRKDDLKHQRQSRARQPMVMELDFAKGTVTDTSKQQQIETAEDEVIQSILARASRRQQEQSSSGYVLRDKKLPTSTTFMARYNIDSSRSEVPTADAFDFSHSVADRDHLYAEVERKCYCLSVTQPMASRIVNGRKNYLPIEEEVQVQGPVFVASTKSEGTNTTQLTELSIIGKVILLNCITMSEFNEEYPEYKETSNKPFVLLFKDAYPFETPLPYISNTTFGRLPKPMREVVKGL
ncbi:Zf-C2HC5 domain-containing protein [Aphelenchoides besseyi]|nr:Zf-C2HC5 domain-containing protein [Aphelenchoides besseyi]